MFGALGGEISQYWRSFDAVEADANDPAAKDAPV
jgi:hypothetical protein